jgi:hypothetical protein
MDVSNIDTLLKYDKHTHYYMGHQEKHAYQVRPEEALIAEEDKRASDVMNDAYTFRCRFVNVLLSCGIPLYRADVILRKFIEGISDD